MAASLQFSAQSNISCPRSVQLTFFALALAGALWLGRARIATFTSITATQECACDMLMRLKREGIGTLGEVVHPPRCRESSALRMLQFLIRKVGIVAKQSENVSVQTGNFVLFHSTQYPLT